MGEGGVAQRRSVDILITTKASCTAPITSLSISIPEIGARNVDFQLTTLGDGQQALQGCLRLET